MKLKTFTVVFLLGIEICHPLQAGECIQQLLAATKLLNAPLSYELNGLSFSQYEVVELEVPIEQFWCSASGREKMAASNCRNAFLTTPADAKIMRSTVGPLVQPLDLERVLFSQSITKAWIAPLRRFPSVWVYGEGSEVIWIGNDTVHAVFAGAANVLVLDSLNQLLLVGKSGEVIRDYSEPVGEQVHNLQSHLVAQSDLAVYVPYGRDRIFIYSIEEDSQSPLRLVHRSSDLHRIHAVQVAPTGKYVLVQTADSIKYYERKTDRWSRLSVPQGMDALKVRFSSDGESAILVGHTRGFETVVAVMSLRANEAVFVKHLSKRELDSGSVEQIAVLPNGPDGWDLIALQANRASAGYSNASLFEIIGADFERLGEISGLPSLGSISASPEEQWLILNLQSPIERSEGVHRWKSKILWVSKRDSEDDPPQRPHTPPRPFERISSWGSVP